MDPSLKGIVQDIIKRASNENTRVVDPSTRKWLPGTVINPEDGKPFTDPGAWDFLVKRLQGGEELAVFDYTDRKGAKKKGYYVTADVGPGREKIYVKVRLGFSDVVGLSFHDSSIKKDQL